MCLSFVSHALRIRRPSLEFQAVRRGLRIRGSNRGEPLRAVPLPHARGSPRNERGGSGARSARRRPGTHGCEGRASRARPDVDVRTAADEARRQSSPTTIGDDSTWVGRAGDVRGKGGLAEVVRVLHRDDERTTPRRSEFGAGPGPSRRWGGGAARADGRAMGPFARTKAQRAPGGKAPPDRTRLKIGP